MQTQNKPVTGRSLDQFWQLVNAQGQPVMEGDQLLTQFGLTSITGGTPPHKASSSGRIWTRDSMGSCGEYFPHAFGLRWDVVRLSAVKTGAAA